MSESAIKGQQSTLYTSGSSTPISGQYEIINPNGEGTGDARYRTNNRSATVMPAIRLVIAIISPSFSIKPRQMTTIAIAASHITKRNWQGNDQPQMWVILDVLPTVLLVSRISIGVFASWADVTILSVIGRISIGVFTSWADITILPFFSRISIWIFTG